MVRRRMGGQTWKKWPLVDFQTNGEMETRTGQKTNLAGTNRGFIKNGKDDFGNEGGVFLERPSRASKGTNNSLHLDDRTCGGGKANEKAK